MYIWGDMSTDFLQEEQKVKEQITQHLSIDKTELHFAFKNLKTGIELALFTENKAHKQSFLFHKISAASRLDALHKMLDYVQTYRDKESSYTIQWTLKDNQNLHTSYFRAKSVLDALEKLYSGRDKNSIVVFSVVLNPIA